MKDDLAPKVGPATNQADMPFGVGLLFALIGTVIFVAFGWNFVWPALWGRLAYQPVTAQVIETRETRHSVTRGRALHGLEAQVRFSVQGTEHTAWVEMPNLTRETKGPEAEAVAWQTNAGQGLTCYYDPLRPEHRVLHALPPLEWGMLFATLFPLAFLLVGIAGMAASWTRTFPRGVRVETAGFVRRLPRTFYLYLLALAYVIGMAYLLLVSNSGWAVFGVFGGIAAVVPLVGRIIKAARVAFPSPERRAARGQGVGHPVVGEAPVRPEPGTWVPTKTVTTERGERLAIRLQRKPFSSDNALGMVMMVLAGCIVLGFLVLALAGTLAPDWMGPPRSPARNFLGFFVFITSIGVTAVYSLRDFRRIGGLRLEVSAHPFVAGRRHDFVVWHDDPVELNGLGVTLDREEQSTQRDTRGGKNARTSRKTITTAVLEPLKAGTRRGYINVPPRSMPSIALKYHYVDWSLVVRLGGRIPCTARFPVIVETTLADAQGRGGTSSTRRQSGEIVARAPLGAGKVWLDHGTYYLPGASISGGYEVQPVEGRVLESAEFSVLWETGKAGWKDLGVCHYEDSAAADGDDLAVYGSHKFQAQLPDGPPSIQGENVEVRWLARLRLRYANHDEVLVEMPFLVGKTEA
jgi:hypothetical protein